VTARPQPRQQLHLDTEHDDRVLVLGCEWCSATARLETADGIFAASVQGFFERHAECAYSLAGCASSVDIT
jgi:hypothetical protein